MDMTAWLEYFIHGLRSQMEEIQDKGKKVIASEKIIKGLAAHNLNLWQEKIIRFLVINERIDNEQFQKLCGNIRRTAQDLASLVEKGLILRKGELKGVYYILSLTVSKI